MIGIKTAILGMGRMGRRHLQAARELGLNIVAVADVNRQSLVDSSHEFSIPTDCLYNDPRTLLDRARPECVVIATTAPAHAPLTCLAAECGAKYILCEKPMATSLFECEQMQSSCEKHGTKLAINHQMRLMEQYHIPKQLLSSPEFGGVASILVSAGNFGVVMNGTHIFELFHYITDEFPSEVTAWFSSEIVPNPRGEQFQDRAGMIRVSTLSGKRLVLECGSDQGHGCKIVYSARYGQIVADDLESSLIISSRETSYREYPTTRYGLPGVTITRKLPPPDVTALSGLVLSALINGNEHCNGNDGRSNVAVAIAAYISNERNHEPVRVDASLPSKRVFPWA